MKKIFVIMIFTIFVVVSGCSKKTSRSVSTHSPHFHESKVSFSSPLCLTSGQLGLLKPHLLLDEEGILYAVWIDEATTFLSRSSDKGKTWDKQIVSPGKQKRYEWWPFCFNKDSQGDLYLVQASNGIFFSYSNDKGKTWIGPVQVNDDTRKFAGCQNPAFTGDNEGTLYIVYIKGKRFEEIDPWKKEKKAGLYLSKSSNGGESWSESVLLKDIVYTGPTDFPSLLSYNNTLYLVYDDSIYISLNGGESWKRILNLKNNHSKLRIIIKRDSHGNIYIAWARRKVTKDKTGMLGGGEKTGFVDICFSKSINAGRSWTPPVHMNDAKLPFKWKMAPLGITGTEKMKYLTQETRETTPFDIAVSENGEIIGIIWKDWRSGGGELYFSYSLDAGESWSKNVRVNDDSTSPMKVGSLTIKKNGAVYVLWTNLGPHKPIPGGFIGDVNVYFSSGNIEKS